MSRRGIAPVIGVVLLVLLTIVLATVVGAMALGMGGQTDDAPKAAITAEFGNHPNQINLTHRSGDPIDVRNLQVRILVDGTPLKHQPDVPGSMKGFDGFPTGPFNNASASNIWTAGETASFVIASKKNSPQPTRESSVVIEFYIDDEAVSRARI